MFNQFIKENGLRSSTACFRGNLYRRKPRSEESQANYDQDEIYVVFACAPYVIGRYEHWKAMKRGGVAGKDYSPFELERPIQRYVFALPLVENFASGQPMMFESDFFFAEYEPV